MEDTRRQNRYEESLEVKVTWPERGTVLAVTRNFSDGGCCIEMGAEPLPPPGTEITLQLNAPVGGAEAPLLRATVRWNAEGRMGCRFIFDE